MDDLKQQFGKIDVNDAVIAQVVGFAVTESYGIVGMVSQRAILDGIFDLLGRDNLAKGISIQRNQEEIILDIYVSVVYGTKISRICQNVQEKVRYTLQETFSLQAKAINIHVVNVRMND